MRGPRSAIGVTCLVLLLASATPARAAWALADLSATIVSVPAEVQVHRTITLSVAVRNAGPMSGTGVLMDVTMPTSVTPVTFSASAGACHFETASLRCDFGVMPSGATATISATVVADRVGTVNVDAYIDSEDIDLFGGNNGDSASVRVNPIPEATREAATLAAINGFRTAQGAPAFAQNARLTDCARAWAQQMASTGTLAHDSGVASCVGGGAYWIGQVVGTGDYEAEMVPSWIDSCSHRAILVYTNATHVGVAVAYGRDAEWWVVNLADMSSSSVPVTTLQNSCFDDPAITGGVRHDAVRTLGKWHTYADSGGAVTRGAVPVNGYQDYYLSMRDPNPGVASITQVVQAQAGRRYRVDAYTRYLSGTPQELHVHFLNTSWSVLGASHVSASRANTDWAALSSGPLTAPSGTAYLRVVAYGPSAPGYTSTFWWDEIELTRL